MSEEEISLLECLERRYDSGAKTLVMTREEAFTVIMLLRKRKRIETGVKLASKYINEYLAEKH